MPELSKEIFRAYDIRGIAHENLTHESVLLIGRAIASEVRGQGESKIIIARDGRLSGPELSEALIMGIQQSGCDVVDIGAVPTPLLYLATHELNCPNGVMLTGSHNPSQYNGLKIVIKNHTLAGEEILNLYQRCQQENFTSGRGKLENASILKIYQQRLVENIKLAKPLRIIVDAGNGIVGRVAPAFYRALGCEVQELYCDVDGNFPNHHPDPSEAKNLQDLIHAVLAQQADIGLAFDGDGDRLGVVTHKGEVIYPDRQMILFSQDVLRQYPQAKIIYDVKCSLNLHKAISAAGGEAIMTKTGHSFVKAELRAQQAKLAGEMSGHIFFADRWYGFDDGIYAGARMLEIVSQHDKDNLWQSLPNSCNTPEIKIPISEDQKFSFIDQFIKQAQFPQGKKITIDGLRVEFADGWGLLRASNTTPCLVMRFEADDENALARIKSDFHQQMRALAPDISF